MARRAGPIGTIVALAVLVALAGCSPYAQEAGDRGCARAVLGDWADGGIDGRYPDQCYLAAIDALPEDLRAYTSAQDDIRRALLSHRRSAATTANGARTLAEVPAAASPSPADDQPPLGVILLLAVVGLACTAGTAGFVLRRLRRGPS